MEHVSQRSILAGYLARRKLAPWPSLGASEMGKQRWAAVLQSGLGCCLKVKRRRGHLFLGCDGCYRKNHTLCAWAWILFKDRKR